jgi:hypothetical protein
MSIKYDRSKSSYIVTINADDSIRSIRFAKFVDAAKFIGALK